MLEFCDIVSAWRHHARRNQRQVSVKSGIAYQLISAYERGDKTNPTLDTIKRLAASYGVTWVEFLSGPTNKVHQIEGQRLTPSSDVRETAAPVSDRGTARSVKRDEHAAAEVPALTKEEFYQVLAELRYAVVALQALAAHAGVRAILEQAPSPDPSGAVRRARTRKHRR